MNNKIGISLALIVLITVPLLQLQAAPTTMIDIGYSRESAAVFLEDTQKVVGAICLLDAYREWNTYPKAWYEGSTDARKNAVAMAESAMGELERLKAIKTYAMRFQNLGDGAAADLESFVNKYNTIVQKMFNYSNTCVKQAGAMLDNKSYESIIIDQKKILDAYMRKYYKEQKKEL